MRKPWGHWPPWLACNVHSLEEEGQSNTEHTLGRSRIHGDTSASTHFRWQPADDGDVAAVLGTAAGQHAGRVESRRRPSRAGAADLWGGPHRCVSAIRGWACSA